MGAYRFNRSRAIAEVFRRLLAGDGDARAVNSTLYRRFADTAISCWRELSPAARESLLKDYPERIKELCFTDKEA